MLVVTRKCNDKVVFPSLGVSVQVLRIAGNKVRLGIDAPPELPVHRQEVADRIDASVRPPTLPFPNPAERPPRLGHAVRNHLNGAALALHCLNRMLETKQLDEAQSTVLKVFKELKGLESQFDQNMQQPLSKPATAMNENAPEHCATHHPRALVVEDNDNERELLADYLRLNGFDVETAVDGLQAMDYLNRSTPPDFVLIDMRLPRLDGRQTVSEIRKNPELRNVRLIAVSGTDQREMNVPIGPTGVDRWFSKPLSPQKLIRALRSDLPAEAIST